MLAAALSVTAIEVVLFEELLVKLLKFLLLAHKNDFLQNLNPFFFFDFSSILLACIVFVSGLLLVNSSLLFFIVVIIIL